MDYGYVIDDYFVNGYTISGLGTGIQFRGPSIAYVNFSRGFKYTPNDLQFFQAVDLTSSNFPFHTASKLSQITFDATFPYMTDKELAALRTFMFVNLPLFETFELVFLANYVSYTVKFKERKIKVTQLQNNFNEVTISFIRVLNDITYLQYLL